MKSHAGLRGMSWNSPFPFGFSEISLFVNLQLLNAIAKLHCFSEGQWQHLASCEID
jgi:hypothetical protein